MSSTPQDRPDADAVGEESPTGQEPQQQATGPGAPGAGAAEQPPSAAGSTPPPPPPPAFGAGTTPPAGGAAPQRGVRYDVPQDQRNLAMISTLGMIIAGFLSPLIVFVITNGDPAKRFANDHAKAGLNFALVFFLASVLTTLLSFLIIGFLLIPLLLGWGLWVVIAGTMQANNGEAPNFPLVPAILQ